MMDGWLHPPARLRDGEAPGKPHLLEGSGLDVGVAGVGLAAAGRSAEVPRDAAIWQGKSRLESFPGRPARNHKAPNIGLVGLNDGSA